MKAGKTLLILLAALLARLPAAADPFSGAPLGSFAEPPAVPFVDGARIYYIAPWEADTSAVPPPPAPWSAADLRDEAELRRWQAERTEAQCAAARLQEDAGFKAFYGAVSPFPVPVPGEVEKIFWKVKLDTASVVWLLKKKYERPRPYLRFAGLEPCVEREDSDAYPSGHSAVAWVFAHMLSDLVPGGRPAFEAAAGRAALNRVLGGVHHPTDTEAGRLLGAAVYDALKRDRDFRGDMELLRRSLSR